MSHIPDNILKCMSKTFRDQLGKAGMTTAEALIRENLRLEKDIHKDISNYLRLKGIAFRHDRTDKRTTGTIGWPDFTFALKGKAIGVEVKRVGHGLSPEQRSCMAAMEANGWTTFIVSSVQQVQSVVETFGA